MVGTASTGGNFGGAVEDDHLDVVLELGRPCPSGGKAGRVTAVLSLRRISRSRRSEATVSSGGVFRCTEVRPAGLAGRDTCPEPPLPLGQVVLLGSSGGATMSSSLQSHQP